MKIGIGLPNPIPGTPGSTLIEWARRAEERGFSTLATIDRIAYPSYESMTTLSAAAAVTGRIGLLTNILLAPTRDPVLLAKEAASVDRISGGRLTLGLGVGRRPDDYEAAGRGFSDRGRRFDAALESIHRSWAGEPVPGTERAVALRPVHDARVPLLIGGMSDRTVDRILRWGAGWTAGSAAGEHVQGFARRVREAWAAAGREGEPRIAALSYFALGDRAEEGATAYLGDYYSFLGDRVRDMIRATPKSPDALSDRVKAFQEAGVDELILDPAIAEVEQVDLLANAVL